MEWHGAYSAWFDAYDDQHDVTGDAGISEADLEEAFKAGWEARGSAS
jgi:hypothetical protein